MSTIVGGAVVFAPLVMAFAAAAAIAALAAVVVGVAVVGGVVTLAGPTSQVLRYGARVAGQGTVAIGQELAAMARQSAEIRSAVRNAAQTYEKGLAQMAQKAQSALAVEAATKAEAWQSALTGQEAQLRRWQQVAVSQASEKIDLTLLDKLEGTIDKTAMVQAQVVPVPHPSQDVQRLLDYAAELQTAFAKFLSGGGGDLFDCTYLHEQLRSSTTILEECFTPALLGRLDPRMQDARSSLLYVRLRLAEMNTGAAVAIEQRTVALALLEQLQSRLDKLAQEADFSVPGMCAGLTLARQIYEDAQVAFRQRRFQKAWSCAEEAMTHLVGLERDVVDVRRSNLETLLDMHQNVLVRLAALKDVDLQAETGYTQQLRDQLDDAATRAASLQVQFERVREQARQGDVQRAWATAGGELGLVQRAEDLTAETSRLLQRCGTESTAQGAQRALEGMGYTLENVGWQEGDFHVTGRQGRREFRAEVLDGGWLHLDLKGYGDASCEAEADAFFQRLEALGLQGIWHRRHHASQAVEVMLEVLHKSGYTVSIEPGADGATLVATRDTKVQRIVADWDAEVHGSQMWVQAYNQEWNRHHARQADDVFQSQQQVEWSELMARYEEEERERETQRLREFA